MFKKIIISILAISIIGGIVYLNKENKIDKLKILTTEQRILVKRDYDKGLEFIKNSKLKKEEERKEKLALTIKYIRDLGFEVDEENHTLSPLVLIENKTVINEKGHYYEFYFLKADNLIKLNKLSKNPFLLKLHNPIGLDFIVDYESIIRKNNRIHGEMMNLSLENDEKISGSIKLSYSNNHFKTYIWLDRSEYMNDLDFRYEVKYENKIKKQGLIGLMIDLNPETDKKIPIQTVIDM